MISIRDVHELSGYAQTISHFSHASLEKRRYLELATDLRDVLAFSLERK